MVVVLTWNANNSERWSNLWRNRFVVENNWEVICLQEAGAPAAEWTHVSGPPWRVDTNRDVVFRKYTYVDLLGRPVNIIHCEWVKRQKNHTVMITKAPAYPISIAGDVGIRPCLGVRVRLTWNNMTRTAILGCVHIVSSDKAPAEVTEMLQYIGAMVRRTQANGWLLFGDFNADPNKVTQGMGATWPAANTTFFPGQTQKNQTQYPLDYGAFSDIGLLAADSTTWYPSDEWVSDHKLMKYEQVNGPRISFLFAM